MVRIHRRFIRVSYYASWRKTIGDTRRTRVTRNVEDEATAGVAARERCREATLHGTYLLAYDGVDISGSAQVPFATAAYEYFDGNGNIETVYSTNFNGTIISKEPIKAKYTVNADCTGTSTYPGDDVDFKYDLFIAPDGSMFTWVQTNPPESVVSAIERRVTRKRIGG
jgi:hypothetical protein